MTTKGILKKLKNLKPGVVCHKYMRDGLPLLWANPARRCPYEDLLAKTRLVFGDGGSSAHAEGEIQSRIHLAPPLDSFDFRIFS